MHPKPLLGGLSNDLLRDKHSIIGLILIVLPHLLMKELVSKCLTLLAHVVGGSHNEVWWHGGVLPVGIFVIHREDELFQLFDGFVDCVGTCARASKQAEIGRGNKKVCADKNKSRRMNRAP